MGLNVRFKEEIRDILRGLWAAHAEATKRAEDPYASAYARGFAAGLAAVAVALGISPLETEQVEPAPEQNQLAQDSSQSQDLLPPPSSRHWETADGSPLVIGDES